MRGEWGEEEEEKTERATTQEGSQGPRECIPQLGGLNWKEKLEEGKWNPTPGKGRFGVEGRVEKCLKEPQVLCEPYPRT